MPSHDTQFIYLDPKADADHVLVLKQDGRHSDRYRPISIHWYRLDESVNIAKGRFLPRLRGTWLPCFDKQIGFGLAINWLGIRVRIDLLG